MTEWKCISCLAFLLVAIAIPAQAVDLAHAQKLAAEGNRAYEAGEYADAVRAYEGAIQAGLDHEILLYNLGNAWFKQGEVGKAIVYYRRALRRHPRDEAVRSNLQRARSLVKDEALAPLSLPIFLRPLGWVYRSLSLDEWTTLALILWFALILLVVARGWWQRAWLWGRGALWTVGVFMAFALIMVAIHSERELLRREAIVIAPEVEVRSGPGQSYRLSFKVHDGLQVFVDRREKDWARIHLGGELVGWVPVSEIEEL